MEEERRSFQEAHTMTRESEDFGAQTTSSTDGAQGGLGPINEEGGSAQVGHT